MSEKTIHVLLVYSYDEQQLVRSDEYVRVDEAMHAYADAEREMADQSEKFEVVLVGADSLETIMRTHGHYFRAASDSLFSDLLLPSR